MQNTWKGCFRWDPMASGDIFVVHVFFSSACLHSWALPWPCHFFNIRTETCNATNTHTHKLTSHKMEEITWPVDRKRVWSQGNFFLPVSYKMALHKATYNTESFNTFCRCNTKWHCTRLHTILKHLILWGDVPRCSIVWHFFQEFKIN